MKYLDIAVPIWDWDGAVLRGGTPREFQRYALTKHRMVADVPAHANGFTCMEEGCTWLLWVRSLSAPIVAHETLHVAFEILRSRGIKPCPKSEEAYAYLQMFLLEQILKRGTKWRTI